MIQNKTVHGLASVFSMPIHPEEKMVCLEGICPHLPIVSEIKTCQASIFAESKYYLLICQILSLMCGGTCQSTQGSTSEQGTSARWTVHQYTKRKICFLWEKNIQCPLPNLNLRKGVAKSIPNYSVEEQKSLLLSICSSSTRIVFCLLISKRKFGEKKIGKCTSPIDYG